MKIVDRKTLMSLPDGTVFTHYQPCSFDGLFIKQETKFCWQTAEPIDWCETQLDQPDFEGDFFDSCQSLESGASVKADFETWCRDGLFDHDQLYAVLERDDLDNLIDQLVAARDKVRCAGAM